MLTLTICKKRVKLVKEKLKDRTDEITSWPEWKQNAISYSVNYNESARLAQSSEDSADIA